MKEYINFRNTIGAILLGIIILMNINFSMVLASEDSEHEKKRVLFISSYSPSFKTFFKQIDGLKSEFEGEDIEFDVEFMDSKRFYTKENLSNFYDNLKYKMENTVDYDALVVADDNALNFAVEHQFEMFKDIPIVFMGINNVENAQKYSRNSNITGIIEAPSILETIQVAKGLNPSAKNVIAISDGTNSGKGDTEAYYAEAMNFKDLEFKELNLGELCFKELGQELNKITNEDIVILLSAFRDKCGKAVTYDESLELIIKNSSQPVYQTYEHGIGDGIIGGKVILAYEQGREAALMVKEIFRGKDISDIPYMNKSPNRYMFDYKILKKYGISVKNLPEKSILINDENSVVKQYFSYLMIGGFIVFLQFSLILFLHLNVTRRKRSEKELIRKKKELIVSNDELGVTNEELMASLDEIKEQDEKIKALIYIDSITGLNNRLSIFQIIDNIIKKNDQQNMTGILFLDIDNFKNINDTYGHDVGDKVLKKIGEKLVKYESEDISIGRFGGDEFLIVVKNQKDNKRIIEIAEELRNVFLEKLIVDGYVVLTTISIGISVYPLDGSSRSELVKKADLALYRAKDSGKNTFIFYEDNMNKSIKEKMLFQESVKKAMRNNEFFLNFQPYVNANTGETKGFEALIRWISEEYGYVSPFKLITTAEKMGLIVEIGEWIMREACLFAKRVNEGHDRKFSVSINISAIQLMHRDFYEKTMSIIRETEVAPELICLEMTETILIESFDRGTKVIEKLRKHGFGIALDDFGTGYSSLKYFKDLPVTVLKIDKSFIDNIATNVYDQKLISAMVNIAHYKGVEVVSEGVETEQQLEVLKEYNCDIIQGYLFSKPLTEEAIFEYIKEN